MSPGVLSLALCLASPAPPVGSDGDEAPAPELAPESAPEPTPEPTSAPGVHEPPPMPERDGYISGGLPATSPPGSRRGEHREGEVWRPINTPTYSEKQPVPSEDAVSSQGNPELSDALATRRKPAPYNSPQRFALEIKFGPYLPNIDRAYNGPGLGPYANIYGVTNERGEATGQPKKGFYGAIAFEYQFFHFGGPLGVGFQWSMFRDRAQALIADPPLDPDESVRSTADSTRFAVMPLALQLVYRFEFLADRVRVPLVPYAKIGPSYAFWWSKNGAGDISTIKDDDGNVIDKARGGAWGFQANFGGMLRLDFLERGEARNLDRQTGINHTYVFGEWQFSQINNFGRKDSINLGASTWLVGLAMEF